MFVCVQILVQLLFVVWLVDADRLRTSIRPDNRLTITCKQPNSHEADPFESSGCSHFYYLCDEEMIGYQMSCRDDRLWYDLDTNACLEFILVPACSGLSRVPVVTAVTPRLVTIDQGLFDCTRLRSGNYAIQEGTEINGKRINFCADKYYTCSNGRLVAVANCAKGTFYDHFNDRCDVFDAVFDCNGGIKVTPPPPTTLPPKVVTEDLHFDCRGKNDGKYPNAAKCSDSFIFCSNGVALKAPCASNTVYNPETQRCENRESVFDCTGVRLSTTLPPSTISTAAPYFFNCSGLENGRNYADPVNKCSTRFFECANGFGWKKECAVPDATAFDVELQKCDYKNKVPACTGKPRPAPQTMKPIETTKLSATDATPVTVATFVPVTALPETALPDTLGRKRTTGLPSDLTTLINADTVPRGRARSTGPIGRIRTTTPAI